MADFQVWHRDYERNRYEKVATIDTTEAQQAVYRTLNGLMAEKWQDDPLVRAEPGEHRSTDVGDIIIKPDGVELRIDIVDRVPVFTEVTIILDQGYTEFLAAQAVEDAAYIGFDPTGVDGYLAMERAPQGWEFAETSVEPLAELAKEIRIDTEAARMRDAGDDYDRMLQMVARQPANDNDRDRSR